jgi:hypothetical protein
LFCLQALNKTGCTLGTSQLRVLPSKTAIVPVNKELMPRSHEELERCSRCAISVRHSVICDVG